MIRIIYRCLLLLALVFAGCSRFSYVDRQTGGDMVKLPHIRVKILENTHMNLKCDGTYRLNCVSLDSSSKGYYSVASLNIMTSPSGMKLAEKSGFVLDTGLIKIYVAPKRDDSHLQVNGKKFHGVLEIQVKTSKLEVINVLNIEDYLKGVLPPEIGHLKGDAFEALKAQSVAARTYAYSKIRNNSNRDYDLVNSILDQVYIGIRGEYSLANKAIEQTRGEILTYHDKPIIAYYHSTCGGNTEDVANAWDQHINGYLKSVNDSEYCSWSKFYTWEMKWETNVLAGYLVDYLREKRDFEGDSLLIQDINVVERFPSGRISHLSVLTDHGEFLFFKDQIRWAFRRPNNPNQILPSSDFKVQLWMDHTGSLVEITAEGKGYGHGVGMCQCGAIGRARDGQTYDQILKTYYSGVEISRAY